MSNSLGSYQTANALSQDLEIIYTTALSYIPVVGGALSGLVELLWPTPDKAEIWAQLIEEAEELLVAYIDEQLTDLVVDEVNGWLSGFLNTLTMYLDAVADPDVSVDQKRDKYNSAVNNLALILPQFQLDGYQLNLLSSYIQLTSLGVLLLRDGAQYGDQLGLNEAEIANQASGLLALVQSVGEYVQSVVELKRETLSQWDQRNSFDTYITLMVSGFIDYQNQLSDPAVYAPLPVCTRELYSNDFGGTRDVTPDWSTITSASGQPMIDAVRLWGWSNVDAVQQSYGGVWGPRLGDAQLSDYGGSDEPPHGWNGAVSADNPITEVAIRIGTGGWLNAIYLVFKDGTQTNQVGGGDTTGNNPFLTCSLDGWIVSQIWMAGTQTKTSSNTYSAQYAVIGFRREDSY